MEDNGLIRSINFASKRNNHEFEQALQTKRKSLNRLSKLPLYMDEEECEYIVLKLCIEFV